MKKLLLMLLSLVATYSLMANAIPCEKILNDPIKVYLETSREASFFDAFVECAERQPEAVHNLSEKALQGINNNHLFPFCRGNVCTNDRVIPRVYTVWGKPIACKLSDYLALTFKFLKAVKDKSDSTQLHKHAADTVASVINAINGSNHKSELLEEFNKIIPSLTDSNSSEDCFTAVENIDIKRVQELQEKTRNIRHQIKTECPSSADGYDDWCSLKNGLLARIQEAQ